MSPLIEHVFNQVDFWSHATEIKAQLLESIDINFLLEFSNASLQHLKFVLWHPLELVKLP